MVGRLLLAALSLVVVAETGCRTCGRRPLFDRRRSGLLEPPTVRGQDLRIPAPAGGLPVGPPTFDNGLPPPSVPVDPSPPRSFRSPAPETLYPESPLLSVPPDSAKSLLEDPALFGQQARLGPQTGSSPQTKEPGTVPPASPPSGPPPDVIPDKPSGVVAAGFSPSPEPAAARVPVGVSGYKTVFPGVGTGQRPTVEGFDGLKAAGFKTVLYLHDPSADVAPTKELAEKKGLAFIGVPVTTANLAPAFSRFAEQVGIKSNRPLYVFDADGTRTGALWYTYFRVVESQRDDAATIRATPLGWKSGNSSETAEWVEAVKTYLGKR